MNMKLQTLIFIIGDEQVLLGYKKRGFGEGKWNGYGGKCDDGESLHDCVKRELYEESSLKFDEEHLVQLGYVQFKENGTIDRRVYVYTCSRTCVDGKPEETEEMRPKWFDVSKMPYDSMWEDAYFWMPFVFRQVPFEATFNLNEECIIQTIHIDLKPNKYIKC